MGESVPDRVIGTSFNLQRKDREPVHRVEYPTFGHNTSTIPSTQLREGRENTNPPGDRQMTGKAVFRGLEVLRTRTTKEMERGSGRCAEATRVPVKRTLCGAFHLAP